MSYKKALLWIIFPVSIGLLSPHADATKRSHPDEEGSSSSLSLSLAASIEPLSSPDAEQPPTVTALQVQRPNTVLTERLIIAPTYAEDVKAIFEKDLMPYAAMCGQEVYTKQRMCYQSCPEVAALTITDYSVFLRDSGELIGRFKFIPFFYQENGPYKHLNNKIYADMALVQAYQKMGYGTELLQAASANLIRPLLNQCPTIYVFDIADGELKIFAGPFPVTLKQVYAQFAKSNLAAVKLLTKCGWKPLKEDEFLQVFYID